MTKLLSLCRYLDKAKWPLLLAVFFVAVETTFELTIPLFMADIIDYGIMAKDIDYILRQGLIMVILALLSFISGLCYARFSSLAVNRFGASLRAAEFLKIQEYSFKNIDHFELSSLITRLTGDVNVIQNAIANIRPIVRGPVMLVMGIFYTFMISPKIALIFLLTGPLLGIALFYIVYKIGPMYGFLQSLYDRLNLVVEENLAAIRIVKAYVREDGEIAKFDKINDDFARHAHHTFRIGVLNLPLFQFTMYAAIVLILYFGGMMILNGELAVGALTGIMSYVLQIMNAFMMLSNIFLMLTRSLASAFRIDEVLKEESDLHDGDFKGQVRSGSICLKDVDFKYDDKAKEKVLSDINMDIQSGETVGIIGSTGSGKTSLVSLIDRLYDASSGTVLVDGRDVKDYQLSNLRQGVGMVLQKNVLFSGTVKDNLLWGKSDASENELWQALKAAGAQDFVKAMPLGLDTYLEEGGVNLSGGQKQRLCIARALLKNPYILILDDSTSAVDSQMEIAIRQALSEIKNMTKIIIAQRISSIMHADKIYILDDGKIVACGNHEKLLATSDIYQELYHIQMEGGQG